MILLWVWKSLHLQYEVFNFQREENVHLSTGEVHGLAVQTSLGYRVSYRIDLATFKKKTMILGNQIHWTENVIFVQL